MDNLQAGLENLLAGVDAFEGALYGAPPQALADLWRQRASVPVPARVPVPLGNDNNVDLQEIWRAATRVSPSERDEERDQDRERDRDEERDRVER